MADRIRAVVLVPLAVTEPYWPTLIGASVSGGQGFDIVRRPDPLLRNSGGQRFSALALFAVDFGARLPAASLFTPPCALACEHRPKPPPVSILGEGFRHDARTAAARLAAELADRAVQPRI